MRLFIAIELPDDVKEKIYESSLLLKRNCLRGSYSSKDNYHITLAFLGEVDPGRVAEIRKIMDGIDFPSCDFTVGKLSCFKRDGGDIYFRSVFVPKSIVKVYYELNERLRDAGFSVDAKKFRAHITLARQAVLAADAGNISSVMPDLHCHADGISLMLSERKEGKLTYTCLYKK